MMDYTWLFALDQEPVFRISMKCKPTQNNLVNTIELRPATSMYSMYAGQGKVETLYSKYGYDGRGPNVCFVGTVSIPPWPTTANFVNFLPQLFRLQQNCVLSLREGNSVETGHRHYPHCSGQHGATNNGGT